jgi:ribosomal protein L34
MCADYIPAKNKASIFQKKVYYFLKKFGGNCFPTFLGGRRGWTWQPDAAKQAGGCHPAIFAGFGARQKTDNGRARLCRAVIRSDL